MTHRAFILRGLLDNPKGLSTTELYHIAIEHHHYTVMMLSPVDKFRITYPKVDSYASILAKLRKEKVIYVSRKRAIKGGMIYVLRKYYTKKENFESLL